MKAKPLIFKDGKYQDSPVSDATHIRIRLPGPSNLSCLPIIIKGTRRDTPCWTWNGDTEKPTLKPSILTRFDSGDPSESYVCHSFVTDGKVQFLPDSTHDLAGQTLDLLEVE